VLIEEGTTSLCYPQSTCNRRLSGIPRNLLSVSKSTRSWLSGTVPVKSLHRVAAPRFLGSFCVTGKSGSFTTYCKMRRKGPGNLENYRATAAGPPIKWREIKVHSVSASHLGKRAGAVGNKTSERVSPGRASKDAGVVYLISFRSL